MNLRFIHAMPPLPKAGDPVTMDGVVVGTVHSVIDDSINLTISAEHAERVAGKIINIAGIGVSLAPTKDKS